MKRQDTRSRSSSSRTIYRNNGKTRKQPSDYHKKQDYRDDDFDDFDYGWKLDQNTNKKQHNHNHKSFYNHNNEQSNEPKPNYQNQQHNIPKDGSRQEPEQNVQDKLPRNLMMQYRIKGDSKRTPFVYGKQTTTNDDDDFDTQQHFIVLHNNANKQGKNNKSEVNKVSLAVPSIRKQTRKQHDNTDNGDQQCYDCYDKHVENSQYKQKDSPRKVEFAGRSGTGTGNFVLKRQFKIRTKSIVTISDNNQHTYYGLQNSHTIENYINNKGNNDNYDTKLPKPDHQCQAWQHSPSIQELGFKNSLNYNQHKNNCNYYVGPNNLHTVNNRAYKALTKKQRIQSHKVRWPEPTQCAFQAMRATVNILPAQRRLRCKKQHNRSLTLANTI
jgi:hypothetical protein